MAFKPGQSGNPGGKPKGAQEKRAIVRRMLEEKGPDVVEKLLSMALDGDINAIKIVMERISPKPKSDRVKLDIDINQYKNQNDLKIIVGNVLMQSLKGELPDDQGRTISNLVRSMADIEFKADEIKRLEVIERKLGIIEG